MKKCPYCAEDIQDEAVFCRHCKTELNNNIIKKDHSDKLYNFEKYVANNYREWILVSKTNTMLSYQRTYPEQKASCCITFLLFLILIIPMFIYLYYASKPAKTYHLTVSLDSNGNLSATGDEPYGMHIYRNYINTINNKQDTNS
jgi:hypothetical protein